LIIIGKKLKQKQDEAKIILSVSQSLAKSRTSQRYSGGKTDDVKRNVISTDSKYLDLYMSKKSLDKDEDNEYMPLKPSQYMLENPMDNHADAYIEADSSDDEQNIRKIVHHFINLTYIFRPERCFP
jgi:hypothetical protein